MEEKRVYTGKVLKTIRLMRGISGPEIQNKLGISTNSLYDYEKGRSFPKAQKAEQLFNLLRINQQVFNRNILNSEVETGVATCSFTVGKDGILEENSTHGKKMTRIEPSELAQKIINESNRKREDEREAVKKVQHEAEVVSDLEGTWLPVISEAAAAECNPGLMPLLDCVAEHSEEQAFFTMGRKTDFAIRVSGSSMMPWYPPKTLLLVRPYQDIQQGKRVVAVLDNGEILFKIFARTKDNRIALMSINDEEGQDFFFPSSGKGIRYICRVIQSIRNEDDLDDAMRESGIHHRWEEKLQQMENLK